MKEIERSVVVNQDKTNQDKTNQCREAHNEIGMMSVLCKRLNIIKRIVAVLYCVEYVPCTVLRTTLLTPPVHCICIRLRSYGSHDISIFAHLSKYR